MKIIYLVVLYDRHCDDTYRASTDLGRAKKLADAMREEYGNRYRWRSQPDIQEWTYRWETDVDDGPRIHIEPVKVEG